MPAHSQALQTQAYAGGQQQRNPAVEGNAGGVAAGPLVLVVDDHADMRAYVAQCLEADFRVLTAAQVEAGLAQITDTLPDLVVSDLMMPVLDGLER